MQGANAVGEVPVSDADAKAGKALSHDALSVNRFSQGTLEAMQTTKSWPQIKQHDYELRFLEFPAINFCAVRLHAKSDDIIMPLAPTLGRKLTAYQPCSETEIFKVLEPEAKEVTKAPNSFR